MHPSWRARGAPTRRRVRRLGGAARSAGAPVDRRAGRFRARVGLLAIKIKLVIGKLCYSSLARELALICPVALVGWSIDADVSGKYTLTNTMHAGLSE